MIQKDNPTLRHEVGMTQNSPVEIQTAHPIIWFVGAAITAFMTTTMGVGQTIGHSFVVAVGSGLLILFLTKKIYPAWAVVIGGLVGDGLGYLV